MKKIIAILIWIFSCILTVLSIYGDNTVLLLISVLFLLLSCLYILYKIYRKYRGRVNIDDSLRVRKPSDKKKVSVIVPNYNYANYINERIESIINQTYPIDEIIILEDASTDNSVDVINKLMKKYRNSNIRLVINKTNSGNVFKQWEKAFKEARNDYVWIAEADDKSNKYFLNVAMQGFEDNNVIMSFVESKQIDEFGNAIKEDSRDWEDIFVKKIFNKNFIMDGKSFVEESLVINNSIINVSSVVFKKIDLKLIEEYIKESQEYRLSGDWIFYGNYLLNGSIAYSTDNLNEHRVHLKSVTSTTDKKQIFDEMISIQDKLIDRYEINNVKEVMKYRNMCRK